VLEECHRCHRSAWDSTSGTMLKLSKKGLCPICAQAAVDISITSMRTKTGPQYEKWLKGRERWQETSKKFLASRKGQLDQEPPKDPEPKSEPLISVSDEKPLTMEDHRRRYQEKLRLLREREADAEVYQDGPESLPTLEKGKPLLVIQKGWQAEVVILKEEKEKLLEEEPLEGGNGEDSRKSWEDTHGPADS